MAPPPPTYISSTGQLTAPPLTKRVSDAISDYATIAYLFVETLVAPIVNPPSTAPRGQRPNSGHAAPSRGGGGGDSSGGGVGGSWGRGGGGGGGGDGANGNRGFMSMTDLRGGETVNSCRSACG